MVNLNLQTKFDKAPDLEWFAPQRPTLQTATNIVAPHNSHGEGHLFEGHQRTPGIGRPLSPHEPEVVGVSLRDASMATGDRLAQEEPPDGLDWSSASDDAFTRAWERVRDSGISPRWHGRLDGSVSLRREFIEGARLLGLWGGRRSLKPQQLLLADALNAGYGSAAVLMPRRSSKTTTLNAFGLGRVASRDEYRVGILTLTTGKAGVSRFTKDVAPMFDRLQRQADKRGEGVPFRVFRGKGFERVEYAEAGSMMVWASSPDDLRGEYFDLVILDESGEPEPDKVTDVKDAALPTLDTAEDGLLVIAGTAGRYREGNLLWDYLERLIDGTSGGVAYAFPDDVDVADIDKTDPGNWARAAELLKATHPGVGTLTTLDKLHDSWRGLAPAAFLREYGSLFGTTGARSRAIGGDAWQALALTGALPEPPKHFVIGVATHIDQRAAAVVAAWRVDGKAHLLLLDHRLGTSWLVERLLELAARYPVKIVHDSSGPMRAEVQDRRLREAHVKLEPVKSSDVAPAAALLIREIDAGRLAHYSQPVLTDAALSAVKRKRYTGWSLGAAEFDGDVTPIEAASFALQAYDASKPRVRWDAAKWNPNAA